MEFSIDKPCEYVTENGILNLYFKIGVYNSDKSIAIIAYVFDELHQTEEYFGSITTCLGYEHKRGRAFINTHSFPGIDNVLEHYGIAEPTGVKKSYNFIVYPEYMISETFLRAISPETYKKYLDINYWTIR